MGILKETVGCLRALSGIDKVDWQKVQSERYDQIRTGMIRKNREFFRHVIAHEAFDYEEACLAAKRDLYEIANRQIVPGPLLPQQRIAQELLDSTMAFSDAYYPRDSVS